MSVCINCAKLLLMITMMTTPTIKLEVDGGEMSITMMQYKEEKDASPVAKKLRIYH